MKSFLLSVMAVVSLWISVPAAFASTSKIAEISPGKANIYVYRNGLGDAVSNTEVELDGKVVGNTTGKSFLLMSVDPGRHELVSRLERESRLELFVESGKHYFVSQELKLGLPPGGIKLILVDEVEGRVAVMQSQQIALNGASGEVSSSVVKTEQVELTLSPAALILSKVRVAPDASPLRIEQIPFRLGVSSVTVERLAKGQGCVGGKGAGLITGKAPVEMYRMQCENGRQLLARCELRQCAVVR